ncbi:unnamed protein product [Haemonchus placei]|uniref:Doublecortin domain-containing protein n=1 Tax=Haemonchus placei TaxID=6290 RepID=A0A158QLT1_HAEPC|nr:unnamed protein product [Haemonchus placei]
MCFSTRSLEVDSTDRRSLHDEPNLDKGKLDSHQVHSNENGNAYHDEAGDENSDISEGNNDDVEETFELKHTVAQQAANVRSRPPSEEGGRDGSSGSGATFTENGEQDKANGDEIEKKSEADDHSEPVPESERHSPEQSAEPCEERGQVVVNEAQAEAGAESPLKSVSPVELVEQKPDDAGTKSGEETPPNTPTPENTERNPDDTGEKNGEEASSLNSPTEKEIDRSKDEVEKEDDGSPSQSTPTALAAEEADQNAGGTEKKNVEEASSPSITAVNETAQKVNETEVPNDENAGSQAISISPIKMNGDLPSRSDSITTTNSDIQSVPKNNISKVTPEMIYEVGHKYHIKSHINTATRTPVVVQAAPRLPSFNRTSNLYTRIINFGSRPHKYMNQYNTNFTLYDNTYQLLYLINHDSNGTLHGSILRLSNLFPDTTAPQRVVTSLIHNFVVHPANKVRKGWIEDPYSEEVYYATSDEGITTIHSLPMSRLLSAFKEGKAGKKILSYSDDRTFVSGVLITQQSQDDHTSFFVRSIRNLNETATGVSCGFTHERWGAGNPGSPYLAIIRDWEYCQIRDGPHADPAACLEEREQWLLREGMLLLLLLLYICWLRRSLDDSFDEVPQAPNFAALYPHCPGPYPDMDVSVDRWNY